MKETNSSKGIGFSGVLGIVFIVLKLLKVITWNWVWVLAPIWIPIICSILFAVIYVLLDSK